MCLYNCGKTVEETVLNVLKVMLPSLCIWVPRTLWTEKLQYFLKLCFIPQLPGSFETIGTFWNSPCINNDGSCPVLYTVDMYLSKTIFCKEPFNVLRQYHSIPWYLHFVLIPVGCTCSWMNKLWWKCFFTITLHAHELWIPWGGGGSTSCMISVAKPLGRCTVKKKMFPDYKEYISCVCNHRMDLHLSAQ